MFRISPALAIRLPLLSIWIAGVARIHLNYLNYSSFLRFLLEFKRLRTCPYFVFHPIFWWLQSLKVLSIHFRGVSGPVVCVGAERWWCRRCCCGWMSPFTIQPQSVTRSYTRRHSASTRDLRAFPVLRSSRRWPSKALLCSLHSVVSSQRKWKW